MLIVNKKLVTLITLDFASAITLWPFILLRSRSSLNDAVLLNHERIHLRQQAEMLLIFFYVLYLIEYLMGRLKGRSHYQSYREISFEREAFNHEFDLEYLNKRQAYSSFRFLSIR
jgi:hypothetical protein